MYITLNNICEMSDKYYHENFICNDGNNKEIIIHCTNDSC